MGSPLAERGQSEVKGINRGGSYGICPAIPKTERAFNRVCYVNDG